MRVDSVNFSVDGLDIGSVPGWRPTVTPPRPIASKPVEQLSEGQRDCLRLVYRHMTSKDIARVLSVSPHTVDMRLRMAMKTLDVASRIEAARMLVEVEGLPDPYQSLIYKASELSDTPETAEMGSPASKGNGDLDLPDYRSPDSPVTGPPAFGPPRTAVASVSILTDRPGVGLPDPEVSTRSIGDALPWGRRNTLPIGARIGWIAGIAIGSAMAFGAVLSALAALKSLI